MRIRRLNHCVYQVMYHIVWGTKYRRKVLKEYTRVDLVKSVKKVQRRYPTWYVHELNIDEDHVHIVVEVPPKVSISKVVQEIKVQSSKDLRRRYKYMDRIYREVGIWEVGYFVSTVGLNEKQIRQYVQKQGEEEKGVDVTTEYS
ncbi:MAG: IS200/IS605 family transposase [Deltaproteobacteria bacterium CG11_big_fil_rev_8_21_14_0_20_45_16]|uniref:IS200/IS605 family transposase n=2 Tax=Katanobacteria TaxID=422282 RepID=A0A2M7X011_UNCKA|nr:MAG: IS200/IS605 family transposase [candidate division WWE3 bacterium CG22_combo_CG10-13_8_21_14_all_39_12]PIR21935.1 MAG: IS200/IS605 family transposase [Deltaproteobacteria bacterium CG11_big_fil_rev_8_21_14_0_20_45_16]PJA39319.1 MAG: IS200/IS605 family transposase [candidate division WWE3 bacterium CG_4_9_14_3_um_filter_39_7]